MGEVSSAGAPGRCAGTRDHDGPGRGHPLPLLDRRFGGDYRAGACVSQAWLDQRERGSIIAIRSLVAVALLLGRRVARLVLSPVCLYYLVSASNARAASRSYLSKVLGRAPRFYDSFRHFFAFGSVGLDRVYLLKDRVGLFKTESFGEDVLLDITRGGQGCFLLGAHLGSFEILRAFGSSKHLRIGL